jgi:tetratricopeptide (TPR) repeat protein
VARSPVYLALAGVVCTMLGLHEDAWTMHRRACELQPDVAAFQANLAASEIVMGNIEQAVRIHRALLKGNPTLQRSHYELSQLVRAQDRQHIDQMQALIENSPGRPDSSLYLRYAIAKELEDLEAWDDAFVAYEQAGQIAASLGNYDVSGDIEIMRVVQQLPVAVPPGPVSGGDAPVPIFIVGLPRSGSTLVERVLARHPQVNSLGETRYLEWALAKVAGQPNATTNPKLLELAARADPLEIRRAYLESVSFRIDRRPFIIDKLPENFLYLKFIVEAFPEAILVHTQRRAMDSCFAMFKQSYFRFAYRLRDLERYYVAHRQLSLHWQQVLGGCLIPVDYESLIADQEATVRQLLISCGLEFEPACLDFERHAGPVATASSAQVREKIHSRSVGRWRYFERHLSSLAKGLEAAGIGSDRI